jgi:hypothetical protein
LRKRPSRRKLGRRKTAARKNSEFAEFGENNAVNKKLGAAPVSAAFAGGLLVFLGHDRAKRSPSVTVGPGQINVSKRFSW